MDEQKAQSKALIKNPLFVIFLGFLTVIALQSRGFFSEISTSKKTSSVSTLQKKDFVRFKSDEEFRSYLSQNQSAVKQGTPVSGDAQIRESQMGAPAISLDQATNAPSYTNEPDRVSTTNVQVIGIDEPDIVKTNGREIFYSQEGYMYPMRDMIRPMPMGETQSVPQKLDFPRPNPRPNMMPVEPPEYIQPQINTKIISAFPPESIRQVAAIDKTGTLLYDKNNLVVLAGDGVYGYNVSDKFNPKLIWELTYKNGFSYSTARLYNGQMYLVSQKSAHVDMSCPMPMYDAQGRTQTMRCSQIYHPTIQTASDTIYSVVKINPVTGQLHDTISFVGASSGTVVYMSPQALYITYPIHTDQFDVIAQFIKTHGAGIFPQDLVQRIKEIERYDISAYSRNYEIEQLLSNYFARLDQNERLRVENELKNKLIRFVQQKHASLEKTGIVRVGLNDMVKKFSVDAVSQVPGSLLNQFSLDEYEGNLRVATTINEQNIYLGNMSGAIQTQSSNGVYILSAKTLDSKGSVTDLGITERIYAIRFLGERAFLVTFRQTDPFYTLDLSNPRSPRMAGELKIPGFSSYLHPLYENIILGVGTEAGQVKVSLFDVTDSANPREIDKYLLSDNWSEVSTNHHAFLQDADNKVFFMPGGRGGYIFSYENGALSLKKTLSETAVKRAIYIDDYFYIIGESGLTVYEVKSWEQVASLSF